MSVAIMGSVASIVYRLGLNGIIRFRVLCSEMVWKSARLVLLI